MSGSVNKVILVGRLGRDPDLKFTPSGVAVAKFSVATDETFKDKAGEAQKRTEWHNIVLWKKLAEIAKEYLTKGSMVYIEGSIQSHKYQSRDGVEKTAYEIVGRELRMLGGNSTRRPTETSPEGQPVTEANPITDDDLII